MFYQDPYPHIIADNTLDADVLSGADLHWPDTSLFTATGIPGNGMFIFAEKLPRLAPASQAFWSALAYDVMLPLYKNAFAQFAPYYWAKYGELLSSVHIHMRLMEALPEFIDHEVHNHHWHDPTWLFTSLLYVDAGADNVQGTSLYATPDTDVDELARISALTLLWEDMPQMQPVKPVGFVRNRMLTFIDSPLSYHGVLPGSPTVGRKRRVIRCHASAPCDLIPTLYGVPPGQYGLHRRRASKKPFVVEWLRKEIAAMKTAHPGSNPYEAKPPSFSCDMPVVARELSRAS